MLDIFSSFDPITNSISSYSPTLFWMTIFMTSIMAPLSMWSKPTSVSWISYMMLNIMNTQATRTTGVSIKGFNSIISNLFILIILINFMGLVPYMFSFSSHLMMTLSLGLPLWLSLIMSAISFNPSSWAAALLPGGAPLWLNPFLVIIETISITVRPITLSFRLAANMSAGHIVLALMGAYTATAFLTSFYSSILLLLTQMGYIMFEMGICLIQTYIFCLLLSLYSDDHPSLH